tara:strand:- start:9149 stop:9262 length:114 start_codon:yes stop_codon:yes gene_type:complete
METRFDDDAGFVASGCPDIADDPETFGEYRDETLHRR